MKTRILVLTFIVLSCSYLFCQAPQGFKYQALAGGAAENILANTDISISISMVQGDIKFN